VDGSWPQVFCSLLIYFFNENGIVNIFTLSVIYIHVD
jgi:hypothetical protein